MNKAQRILVKTHLVVSLVPWALLAYCSIFTFSSRLLAGCWPDQYERGLVAGAPQNSVLHYLDEGVTIMQYALLSSVPAWFIVLLLRNFVPNGGRGLWRAKAIFLLGWFALAAFWLYGPVDYTAWWH